MVRTVAAAGAVVLGLGLGALGVAGVAPGGGGRPGAATAVSAGEAAGAAAGAAAGETAGEAVGTAGGVGAARTYVAPLDPPLVVARPFDGPAAPWAAGHRGVDLAAVVGQPVLAPQGGVVSFAGTVVDRGVVTVTHDDGLRSSLEPVRWTVRPGQRVVRGQGVGTLAPEHGHCAPASCLHWGLRHGETYLDPMRWVLDRGPVVLLPEG